MADENYFGGASSGKATSETSGEIVDVNVKTLDSQIHTFRVNKSIQVSLFKEQIANAVGVPAGQQRLIFRGKVLKDDQPLSHYHVDDGHTLHLVARQAQSQSTSGTTSAESARIQDNQATDSTSGAPRRIGHVSHSVVLGTVNIGDQGEGNAVPDISRIIGAVLNSVGIGNTNIAMPVGSNSTTPSVSTGIPTQASRGNESEGMPNNGTGRNQAGNILPGQIFMNNPIHPFHFTSPGSIPMPLPDALTTISEFINRMEIAFSHNGSQTMSSSSPSIDASRSDSQLSNAQGIYAPASLAIVMQRAHQLLSGMAASAISQIAGRIEREGNVNDPIERRQIQMEAMQVGISMQHLGFLLLELGRAVLTLRMGQSPAESSVNAGPAVYISPTGPNPIMVQPFPLQTTSLFTGGMSNPQTGGMGPVGLGDISRNVNIHIHTGMLVPSGTPLNGSRANTSDTVAEVANPDGNSATGNGSTDSGSNSTRVPSVRNVAVAVPSPSLAEAGGHVLNVVYPFDSRSHQNPSHSSPSVESESLVSNMTTSNSDSSHLNPTISEINSILHNMLVHAPTTERTLTSTADTTSREHETVPDRHQFISNEVLSRDPSNKFPSKSLPMGDSDCFSEEKDREDSDTKFTQSKDPISGDKDVPSGLGHGALLPKPKKRVKLGNSEKKNDGTPSTSRGCPDKQSIARGQEILKSLISQRSNEAPKSNSQTTQLSSMLGQIVESISMDGQDENGQLDVGSIMSQVLQSPAMNNLLSGVSEQTGIGSSSGLRNMLEQITQSPPVRNTIDQIAQGQGGVDFSSMFQKLMPVVSQVLGRTSSSSELPNREAEIQPTIDQVKPVCKSSEIDFQRIVQMIEHHDSPSDILRTIVEDASHLVEGNYSNDLSEIYGDENLANEFMEMLHREIYQRLQTESSSTDKL